MLEPSWMTAITIAGGSLLTLVCYGLAVVRGRDAVVSLEVIAGPLINALTAVTMACFIYNLCVNVSNAAVTHSPLEGLRIDGNEALIFWILVYSLGHAVRSLRHGILSVPSKTAA